MPTGPRPLPAAAITMALAAMASGAAALAATGANAPWTGALPVVRPAAHPSALDGPHIVTTRHLLMANLPVVHLPGGGYIAMGTQYMVVSQGSLARWKLMPIPRRPGTEVCMGITWLGGGRRTQFFTQSTGKRTAWIGPPNVYGWGVMLPGPKFKYLGTMMMYTRPHAFLNSRIGVVRGLQKRNFVLILDGGARFRPLPPLPGMENISRLRWLSHARLAVVATYQHKPQVMMFQLTPQLTLRLLWHHAPVMAYLGNHRVVAKFPKAYQVDANSGGYHLVGITPGLLWIEWDNNLNAVSTHNGRLVASVSGERLVFPRAGHYTLAIKQNLVYTSEKPGGHKILPWMWRGWLAVRLVGDHLIAHDDFVGRKQLRKKQIWTIGSKHIHYDFTVSVGMANQYLKTRRGLFVVGFRRIARISFRKKALVPLQLQTLVPYRGPWDPIKPLPAAVEKKFFAVIDRLPRAAVKRVVKWEREHRRISLRRSAEILTRWGEAYLKAHPQPQPATRRHSAKP